DELGLGDDDRRRQQTEAVLEYLVTLVVVEHPGDRTALDGGEHQQNRFGRVAHHDAHDVTVPDTLGREHRGVAVDGVVGLAVGDLAVLELQEHVVRVLGRTVLEDLADRRLGGGAGPEPGDHAAHDRRRVLQQTRYLLGDV